MWGRFAKLKIFLLFINILGASLVSGEKSKREVNKADWNFIAAIAYGRNIFNYGAAIKPTVVMTSWTVYFYQESVFDGIDCFGKMGVRIGPDDLVKVNSESLVVSRDFYCTYLFADVMAIPEKAKIQLVDRIVFHPKWEAKDLPENDQIELNNIVLLYLKESIPGVTPIPISKAARAPGTTCKIVSWQSPSTKNPLQPTLGEIDLKILTDAESSASWIKKHKNLTQEVIAGMLKSKFVAKGTLTIYERGNVLVCNKMIQGILEDVLRDNEYSFEDVFYHATWVGGNHSESISPEQMMTSTVETPDETTTADDDADDYSDGHSGKIRLHASQVRIIFLILFYFYVSTQ